MTQEEFEKLQVGDYVYDIKSGEEWQILKRNGDFWTCNCTKEGEEWRLDAKMEWSEISAKRFSIGRHPDNRPKEPEQPTAELQKMLIKDAIPNGLKVGDKVWVQMEVRKMPTKFEAPNSDDFITMGNPAYNGANLIFNKETTEILFEPKPYMPKHGEKCRVEKTDGKICECTAVFIENEFFALVPFKENKTFIDPKNIKQFLPL